MKYLWVANSIISWAPFGEGGPILSEEKWKRSYEIWKRACDLINRNESPFDLSDGIANLKRSLNHRLQLIEETYQLKKIPFYDKPKGYLELLEKYDIVRPFVMKNLMAIRNEIEHKDSNPPEIERCKELVDVIWYFLKSTDSIVQIKKEDVGFALFNDDVETQYGFSVSFKFDTNTYFELAGWFPQELISEEKKENFFRIDVEDFVGKEKFKNSELHADKLVTDKWIRGKVSVKNEIYFAMVQIALSAY